MGTRAEISYAEAAFAERLGEVGEVVHDEAPGDLVRSVSRALRILEEVGAHPDGISAKRVARRCGLHVSTTYHLLRTLAWEGYLERLPSGDYALGLAVADRFRDLAVALAQPPRVRDALTDLAAQLGLSVYLARFVDERVAIVEVVEAPGSPHLEDLVVGFDEAAHATALGKALLSTLRPGDRAAYLDEQGMPAYTPATIRDRETLDHDLVAGARRGWFAEHEQYRRDVGCLAVVAAPGADRAGTQAIAVSGRPPRLLRNRREVVAGLEETASLLG